LFLLNSNLETNNHCACIHLLEGCAVLLKEESHLGAELQGVLGTGFLYLDVEFGFTLFGIWTGKI